MFKKNQCHPCGYDLLVNEKYCPKCGRTREEIQEEWIKHVKDKKIGTQDAPRCPTCHKFRKIGAQFLFCPYCGNKYPK